MVLSFYLNSAPVTSGASETSRLVAARVDQGWRHLQNSRSLGSGSTEAFDQLYSVAEGSATDNWDGYGAAPVSQETFRQAYRFLESLPLGMELPSVGVEPDGQITFEWYRSPRRILSVSVSAEGDLHYAALLGPNKAYGTEAFFGELPKAIFDQINRVMAA